MAPPVTALLLVLALHLDRAGERLARGDADIGGVEFHAGALDAGRGDTHMGLAVAAEDGLAGRLLVVDCEGGILDHEPVQRSGQPVLVGLIVVEHGGASLDRAGPGRPRGPVAVDRQD